MLLILSLFQKKVKVSNTRPNDGKVVLSSHTKIVNPDTNEAVSAIQEIKLEVTPENITTKIKRIKFNNTDW